MSRPFDATTRVLLERHPEDWLPLIGLDRSLPVRVVDSNVSTTTAEVDKALRVDGPSPGLVHIEVQRSYDRAIPLRLLRYNVLLRYQHELPVVSAVVLLVPEADGPALTGPYVGAWPDERCRVEFVYPVIRVWQLSAEALAGAPGTLPLAALAARDEEEAIRVLSPALAAQGRPPTPEEREVAAACYLFAGLKFDRGLAARIFKGVESMRESSTYQAILEEGREEGLAAGREKGREEGREEGRIEGERRTLLRQATRRFGAPEAAIRARLEAISDTATLDALLDRVLTATSWDDLLTVLP